MAFPPLFLIVAPVRHTSRSGQYTLPLAVRTAGGRTVHRQREVHPRNPAFPPAARDGRFRVCACGCVPGFASGGLSSQCSLFGLWPRRSLCVLWFSALLSCSPFGSLRRLSFPWLCVSSSNTSLWCGLVSFPGSLGLLRFGGGLFLRRHLPRDHCRSDRVKSKYVLICSSWVNMFTTPPHGEKKNHAVEGNIFERTRSRTKPPPGGQDTARRRLINSVGTITLLRSTYLPAGQYLTTHLPLGQYLTGIINYLFVYFD